MKKVKNLIVFVLSVVIAIGVITPISTNAASVKVGKPSVTAKVKEDSVALTIGKTDNAEGFRIYVKAPGEKKYQKVKTLSENGTKERSYTYKVKKSGEYVFKVRGYNNSTGKTIWGKYCKACKANVTVPVTKETKKTDSNGVDKDLKEFLDSYEAFLDDYAKFMKNYISAMFSLDFYSMADECDKMDAKLRNYEKKFDSLNPSIMSAADYKYYLESLARIEKKLLNLYF